jgi:5-methylcytosine-specific restriction endonuclease McrA
MDKASDLVKGSKKVKPGNVPHDQRDKRRAYSKKEVDEKYKENETLCEYCSESTLRKDYRGDHREAHGKGGRTDKENLAGSCSTCNLKKSDKDVGTEPGKFNPPNPLKKDKPN